VYIKTLLREISSFEYSQEVETVYLGGGTPTVLDTSDIEKILSSLERKFHFVSEPEVSIEANPETVDRKKLKQLKAVGINRLSLGIQSLNQNELTLLGRVHDSKKAEDALWLVSDCYENFSVDIIYGIPGQDITSLDTTLKTVLEVKPPHISAYELTVEEGTYLYEEIRNNRLRMPEEEKLEEMYWYIVNTLKAQGYEHYEISNYAIPGFQCRHNLNYWLRGEYIGFGPSASSLVSNKRISNVSDIHRYIEMIETKRKAVVEEVKLKDRDIREEEIMLGLRTSRGIDIRRVSNNNLINELKEQGLIKISKDRIVLTDKGMLLSNRIILELIENNY
jgi:oxygen-independent coproporphyrinogen-3 oxidase